MATVVRTTVEAGDADQYLVMHGIGWDGYRRVLRARGERARPKLVYLDGDLHLVSPAFAHERLKKRLGHLVMVVVEELDIPCVPAGETTFGRRSKDGAVEADESFYLSNLGPILEKRGKDPIDLRRDPPPDLVIEVVNTHGADAAVEVWRRLGVPEVWVCDTRGLKVLVLLQPEGAYVEAPVGRAFPFLAGREVWDWVTRSPEVPETAWLKELRRWVAGPLADRVRDGQAPPPPET